MFQSWVYIGKVKRDIMHDYVCNIMPYILTLANRNDPICVVLPNVAKASSVTCRCRLQFR